MDLDYEVTLQFSTAGRKKFMAILERLQKILCLILFIAIFTGVSPAYASEETDPEPPAVPVIALDGSRLFWEVHENAVQVSIFVNGVAQVHVSPYMPWFDLRFITEGAETFVIHVGATCSNVSLQSEPLIFTSDGSEPDIFPTPDISISGYLLSWVAVEYAELYRIYVDGVFAGSSTTPRFHLHNLFLSNGAHIIQVTANGFGIALPSELSNIAVYVQNLPELAAPVIREENLWLYWDICENASQVRIYVNGSRRQTIRADISELYLPDLYRGFRYSIDTFVIDVVTIAFGFATSQASESLIVIGEGICPRCRQIAKDCFCAVWCFMCDRHQDDCVCHLWCDYCNRGMASCICERLCSNCGVRWRDCVCQFSTPVTWLEGSRLFWDACDITSGLTIYINGIPSISVSAFSPWFDLRFSWFNNNTDEPVIIQMRAMGISISSRPAPSELSEPIGFTFDSTEAEAFAAPVIFIDGNILSWKAVEYATSYEIYLDGEFIARSWLDNIYPEIVTFDLHELRLSNGTYNIQVRTDSRWGVARQSELSNTVVYVQALPELATPVIWVEDGRLFWEVCENSQTVSIYIDGSIRTTRQAGNTGILLYNINWDFRYTPHTFELQVSVMSWSFATSQTSEPITIVGEGYRWCFRCSRTHWNCNCPTLYVSRAFADPGDENIAVHLRLTDAPAFSNISLRIEFPQGLTLIGYNADYQDLLPAFSGFPVENPEIITDYFFVSWDRLLENPLEASGTILTLFFSVNPDTEKKPHPIIVTTGDIYGWIRPINDRGESFNLRITDGGINVQNRKLGDLNGDGRITSADAALFARWYAGHPVSIDIRAAHITCDYEITFADLTRLVGVLAGHYRTLRPTQNET